MNLLSKIVKKNTIVNLLSKIVKKNTIVNLLSKIVKKIILQEKLRDTCSICPKYTSEISLMKKNLREKLIEKVIFQ